MTKPSDHQAAATAQPNVWAFFYGSYMNFGVLREVEIVPESWCVARLDGFDIRIQPRANLIRSDQHCVYGIVVTATHAELTRLYAMPRTCWENCTSRKQSWSKRKPGCGVRRF